MINEDRPVAHVFIRFAVAKVIIFSTRQKISVIFYGQKMNFDKFACINNFEMLKTGIQKEIIKSCGKECLKIENDGLLYGLWNVCDLPIMPSAERLPLFFYGFCITGEADLEIAMKPYKFSKGDIIRIRMGQTLLVKSVSEDFNSVMFFFDRRVISGFVSGLKVPLGNNNPIFKTSNELYESLLKYLKFVKSRLDLCKVEKSAYLKAASELLLKAMLCEVLNEVSKSCVPQEKGSRVQEIFLKFSSMVNEEFRNTRNVKHYADQLCITPKYLCKVVSECVGSSPSQFIDALVMKEAKEMLCTTDLSIQAISDALNFPNQSFFGRFFKTHAGVSPGSFRNTES